VAATELQTPYKELMSAARRCVQLPNSNSFAIKGSCMRRKVFLCLYGWLNPPAMVEPWSYIGFVMGFGLREINERYRNEYSDCG
jgi:hypothetical protein